VFDPPHESENLMRTQLVTSALAVAATSALIGLGTSTATARTAAPPDPMKPGTVREVGTLIECTGTVGRVPVRANLYQNATYGNHLEVLVHDGTRREAGGASEPRRPFVDDGSVRATTRIKGARISVRGTVEETGKVKRVDETYEDAGLSIHSTGRHRLLATDLTATYRGAKGTLTCATAFAFDLKVVKTSLVD
jgi:hypothetical protein